MDTTEMKAMMVNGWRPVERPCCIPARDADGRPVVIFIWEKTTSRK